MKATLEQIRKTRKFDSHIHIGEDSRNPCKSDLGVYVDNALKINVERANVIGVPTQRYETKHGMYAPVTNDFSTGKFETFSEMTTPEGKVIRGKIEKNPFAYANKINEAEIEAAEGCGIEFRYTPLLHPLCSTKRHLSELCERYDLLKFHGSSWGFGPGEVPVWVYKTLSKTNTGILPHVDWSSAPKTEEHYIKKANDPLAWIGVCQKYDIRASLPHGLRLCKDSWDIVKKSGDQFIVGFGPELTTRGYRVKKRHGDYVEDLIEMADWDHLAFDTDFAFNPFNDDYSTGKFDWKLAEKLAGKIPVDKLEDFFHGNAERFYELGGKK